MHTGYVPVCILTTFKRLCKDMHGMSPSDYRKSLLQ